MSEGQSPSAKPTQAAKPTLSDNTPFEAKLFEPAQKPGHDRISENFESCETESVNFNKHQDTKTLKKISKTLNNKASGQCTDRLSRRE
jgi:hypothetical protein